MSVPSRGTSKVFKSRLITADPMTFREKTTKPDPYLASSHLRESLSSEAHRLNRNSQAFYSKASEEGKTKSAQVQASL